MYKLLFFTSLAFFALSAVTPIAVAMWLMAKGEEIPFPFRKPRTPANKPALRLIRIAQVIGALAFLGAGVFVVLWIRNA